MAIVVEANMAIALCHAREVVAFGIVHSVNPTSISHFQRLGETRVSICITNILSPDIDLKFPCGGFETLGDILPYTSHNKPFIIWERSDVVPLALLSRSHPAFIVGDELEMITFENTVVAIGVLKGYEQYETYSFARMEILHIMHDGIVENAMSLMVSPTYEVGKEKRWSISFLRRKCKRVHFNTDDYGYYYHRRNAHEEVHEGEVQRRDQVEVQRNQLLGSCSDFLTGVDEAEIGGVQHEVHSCNDVLTGVDEAEVQRNNVIHNGVGQVHEVHSCSDILTGVDEVDIQHNRRNRTSIDEVQQGHQRLDEVELHSGSDFLTGVDEAEVHRNPTNHTRVEENVVEDNNHTMIGRKRVGYMKDMSVFDLDDDSDHTPDVREEGPDGGKRHKVQNGFFAVPSDYYFDSLQPHKRTYRSLKRKRVTATYERKKERMLNDASILQTLLALCCNKKCLRQFQVDDILEFRRDIWLRKGGSRATCIVKKLSAFVTRNEGGRGQSNCTIVPHFKGKAVCMNAYQKLLGISHGSYWHYVGRVKEGVTNIIHGNMNTRKTRKNSLEAYALLHTFLHDIALPQPHLLKKLPNGNVVTEEHLPMGVTKQDMIESVGDKLKERGMKELTKRTMYNIWRRCFSNIKVQKRQRMSKCTTCDDLKRAIETAKDKIKREQYKLQRTYHIQHVQHARRKYAIWREEAISFPDKYMCLIIDGMDQNTTTFPRFLRIPPRLQSAHFLKTHLCGVLVHGIKLFSDIWIDALHLHDSNQVISSIMRALQATKVCQGFIPPVLRIQCDNCWRENKNIYMFSFCSMLVARKIFKEVELGYLLVGHTHEDIDQVFSTISNEMNSRDVETLDDLMSRCGRQVGGRKETTTASLLERVYDWKKFITPYINKGSDALKGHTNPHYFRFFLRDGKPIIQWQFYSMDTKWEPEEGYSILSSLPLAHDQPDYAPIKPLSERHEKELQGLTSFVEYKKVMANRFPEHRVEYEHIIDETNRLLEYLARQQSETTTSSEQSPFWLSSSSSIPVDGSTSIELTEELQNLLLPRKFCGKASEQRRDEFIPETDIQINDFVALRPADEDYPIWIAKVISIQGEDNNDNHGRPTHFTALWYEPKGRRKGLPLFELYKSWMKKDWVPNKEPLQEQLLSTVIVSWRSKASKTKRQHGYDVEQQIRIPERRVSHIENFIKRIQAESNIEEDLEIQFNDGQVVEHI